MLQIKTILKYDPNAFDEAVNAALAEGWTLTRRTFDFPYFMAMLELPQEERGCWNCTHQSVPTTQPPCRRCSGNSEWEPAK